MSAQNKYGNAPENLGMFEPEFFEYMTYQYLPIQNLDIDGPNFYVPENLEFAYPMINRTMAEENARGNKWRYVYLTAKRGYATPGHPLNRPGWHADGFGTPDVNYVWVDKYPTVFAVGDFGYISDDHIKSIRQFEDKIEEAERIWHYDQRVEGETIELFTYPDKMILRLDDTVVHAAPEVPEPGGERSFLKVSFSNDKYNLLGNAHNYGLDYDWEMLPRDVVRNDPAKAGKDSA